MPKRLAACISLSIVSLAAPGAALAGEVVKPSSVEASTTVPAGGSTTLTLRCPALAVALNAAVSGRDAAVTVRRSIPGKQAGDWTFRASAAAGASNRGVRAVLRCVRLKLPGGFSGVRLVVATRRSPTFDIPGGSSIAAQIGCPAGFAPTGYGLDRGARRDVTIAAVIPTAEGWNFSLENTGASSARARFRARCLKSVVPARRAGEPTTLSFRFAHRAFSDTVFQKPTSVSHSCRRSEFSVATGSEVDSARNIELRGSSPAGTLGGLWTFARGGGGEEAQTFLVCLNRRSQFG